MQIMLTLECSLLFYLSLKFWQSILYRLFRLLQRLTRDAYLIEVQQQYNLERYKNMVEHVLSIFILWLFLLPFSIWFWWWVFWLILRKVTDLRIKNSLVQTCSFQNKYASFDHPVPKREIFWLKIWFKRQAKIFARLIFIFYGHMLSF